MSNDNDFNALETEEDIKRELRYLRRNQEENEGLIKDIHEFLFEEDEITGRRVVDDIRLVRKLNNNFSGFSAALGFIVGLFTVGVPIILGMIKIWEMATKYFR